LKALELVQRDQKGLPGDRERRRSSGA